MGNTRKRSGKWHGLAEWWTLPRLSPRKWAPSTPQHRDDTSELRLLDAPPSRGMTLDLEPQRAGISARWRLRFVSTRIERGYEPQARYIHLLRNRAPAAIRPLPRIPSGGCRRLRRRDFLHRNGMGVEPIHAQ